MAANFSAYPQKMGSRHAGRQHRSPPCAEPADLFHKEGKSLSITSDPETYKPGDVVTWDLDGKGMTHTGRGLKLLGRPEKALSHHSQHRRRSRRRRSSVYMEDHRALQVFLTRQLRRLRQSISFIHRTVTKIRNQLCESLRLFLLRNMPAVFQHDKPRI